MGFLDHTTNNIIVDAVLTDKGREKLASASGLSIIKYAFADTEVDYTILLKYGEIVGKEKIEKNTPIFEASTSGWHESRHDLLVDSSSGNIETITIGPNIGTALVRIYEVSFSNFDPNTNVTVDVVYTYLAWQIDGSSVATDTLVGDPNGILKRARLSSTVAIASDGTGSLTITFSTTNTAAGTYNAAFEVIETGGVTSSAVTESITKP